MHEMDHTSDITQKFGENMKIVWNKKIYNNRCLCHHCPGLQRTFGAGGSISAFGCIVPGICTQRGETCYLRVGLCLYPQSAQQTVGKTRVEVSEQEKRSPKSAAGLCNGFNLSDHVDFDCFICLCGRAANGKKCDRSEFEIRDNIPRVEEWVSDTLSSSNFCVHK